MGLGDVAHEVGDVKSRRDIENFSAGRYEWKRLLSYHPHWVWTFCDMNDKEEVKMFVELLDDVLLNGVPDDKMTEDMKAEVKRQRDELAGEL